MKKKRLASRIISQCSSFLRNESGNYAMIFAIAMPVIAGSMSLAVETSSIERSKTILKNSLDAAALATGKHLAVTVDEDELEVYAKKYFEANVAGRLDASKLTFDLQLIQPAGQGNRVYLTADYDYPTVMAGVFNKDELEMEVFSEVAAGNRTIEVAIVMDNSGSMDSYTGGSSDTRMAKAKEAATSLTNQLFELTNISNKPDPVKISVVPFGASVNIGSDHRDEDHMDMNGWSSIHHENLDWDATSERGDDWPGLIETGGGFKGYPTGSQSNATPAVDWLSRWTLFDRLDTDWEGCVEMRPWPYHTTDEAPSDLNADTLYVPLFAPDEPTRYSYEDRDYKNNYLNDHRRAYANPLTYYYNGSHRLETYIPGQGYNTENYTRQHWRQGWTMKYNSNAKLSNYGDSAGSNFGKYGPNYSCSTDPVLPVTTTQQDVIDAIDDMDSGGYTNVQSGIVWGWRSLSPGAPFTDGRDYSTIENDKYIIVLTDGNNTIASQNTSNDSRFNAWGYEKDERVYEGISGSVSNVEAMNTHTETTCSNIKTIIDGDNEPAYKIFTIAYDVADGSSVKTLLYNCASDKENGGKYYYDVSGNALTAAMQAIGDEISDLRISQ